MSSQPTDPPRPDQPSTIAAALTAPGRGAIAVVEVLGPDAHRAVLRCFTPATARFAELHESDPRLEIDRVRFGHWRSSESVVVVATGDLCVEVHCHGGRAAVQSILDDLSRQGIRPVDSGELLRRQGTRRQGTTPTDAELRQLVTRTQTIRTAAIALDQLRGAMRKWAIGILELLRDLPADAIVPDAVRREIARVQRWEPLGRHLVEPWQVVVAGPPNVGKSSLVNAMLGFQRAITFDTPGTTRDVLQADSAAEGWPIRLSDTAGIRGTVDALEAEGVRRASDALERADLILAVVDSVLGPDATHREILARTRGPAIVVFNKADLVSGAPAVDWLPGSLPRATVSATSGQGIDPLVRQIAEILVSDSPAAGEPVPITAGQRSALSQAERAERVDPCRESLRNLVY